MPVVSNVPKLPNWISHYVLWEVGCDKPERGEYAGEEI